MVDREGKRRVMRVFETLAPNREPIEQSMWLFVDVYSFYYFFFNTSWHMLWLDWPHQLTLFELNTLTEWLSMHRFPDNLYLHLHNVQHARDAIFNMLTKKKLQLSTLNAVANEKCSTFIDWLYAIKQFNKWKIEIKCFRCRTYYNQLMWLLNANRWLGDNSIEIPFSTEDQTITSWRVSWLLTNLPQFTFFSEKHSKCISNVLSH